MAGLLDSTDYTMGLPVDTTPTDEPPPTQPDASATLAMSDTAPAAPAPAAAPGVSSDWGALLGTALGGGPAGIANLTPAQETDAGRRSLLNFGIGMLANSGPSYVPRSFGQILAGGLAGAEQTRTSAEQTAAVQSQTKAELALQQQDRAIRLAQYNYQMKLLGNQAEAGQNIIQLLGGQKPTTPSGATTTNAGTTVKGTDGLLAANLPPPNDGGDISTFKDPNLAKQISDEAVRQNLDPRIALAVAHQESRGDSNAPPGDGGKSIGPFQIGQDEAASVGVTDRSTVPNNITAGVGRLKQLIGKYGDVPTALLAYNAGEGTADAVRAGKTDVPAATQQYIANVNHIMAPKPGDPGYVPSSGVRTTFLPNAPAGVGTTAPGAIPAAISSLPPELRAVYAARIQANPADLANITKDMAATALEYSKRPNYRVLSAAEAAPMAGTAYDPQSIYQIDQTTGKLEQVQQGQRPVNITDTPEAQTQKVALAISQKRLDTMGAAAENARRTRTQLSLLGAIDPAVGTANALFEKYPVLQKVVQTIPGLGSPDELAKMSAQQAYQSIVSQLSVNLRDAGTGRLSNQEMDRFTAALPSIGQSPQSRALILGMLNTMVNRQVDENNYAQDFFAKNHTTAGLDPAMDHDLGPVVPQGPDPSRPLAEHTQFRNSLHQGQVYYKPNLQFDANSTDPAKHQKYGLSIYQGG